MSRTVQAMADYFAWQVGLGRGQFAARLDPRGMEHRRHGDVVMDLAIPEDGHVCDEKQRVVFVRAIF